MITVYVPATSANVGSGFDTVGLALGFGNTVAMKESNTISIISKDGYDVPVSKNNLVFKTAKNLYEICGRKFYGLHMEQESPIPTTRGLGSSSACIVAGLVGANALMKNPCTRAELLDIAAEMEGHPDNVAPAILGGLVTACMENGRVYSVKKELSPALEFAVFIPSFELSTKKARAALPEKVLHKDAVFNMSRAALLSAALCEGRVDLLPVVCEDTLHQPYRLGLVPGGKEIFSMAKKCGAEAVFLSGAGPAIIAVVETHKEDFWKKAKSKLKKAKQDERKESRFTLMRSSADNVGARLI